METKKKHELSLAKRMAISLVCGLVAGLAFMFLREHLNASGQAETWTTINNLLFQDITAEGAERAFGIFYIIGQLFIKALQLVIIPMVFTSISLAIGSIADTRTMGRISAKTLFWFLLCSFLALLLAGCVGYGTYSMGLFNTHIEGLAEASGSTGSNPLNVLLNIIPSNIVTAFGSNGAVLSSVFLAVATGLSMNTLGESRTASLRRLLGEVNDVVVVFLNFIVSNFAPFAVFVLLTRTFAIYGIDYLKPALVYVVVTVVLLLAFLVIAYPLVIALGAKLNPFTFIRKIANVAVFGFSTSSSAATLPLNIKVCEEEFGVAEFLDELRAAGVKVAICTNMLADIQMEKLEYLGIADKVDCLVTSEEAGVDKPGSAIFWLAMHKCRCLPEETVMVGDNFTHDIQGALDVGIDGVWLNWTDKPKPVGELSYTEVSTFEQAAAHIRTLL